MSGPVSIVRQCCCALLALGALACAAVPARAQDSDDGLHAGSWLLAPYFTTGYRFEDNLFRDAEGNEISDRVAGFEAGLAAIMPFSNSTLELSYEALRADYAETEFERTTAQTFEGELELNFSTGDTLILLESYSRDFARTERVDPGQELRFTGEPYTYNTWMVEFSRGVIDRQGYLIRIQREDLIYDANIEVAFFEYRGFNNVFEYRHPIPGNRLATVTYRTKRFNHYDPTDVVGQPFRKEEQDAILLGFTGELGQSQPIRLQVGFSRFRYKGTDSSDFEGIVGGVNWRVKIGGRTDLVLNLIRRPLPSSFDTFYINNTVQGQLRRNWRRFSGTLELRSNLNVYGDPFEEPNGFGCSGTRRDSTVDAGAIFSWKIQRRMALELSTFHYDRSSNCDVFEFTASDVTATVSFGWF